MEAPGQRAAAEPPDFLVDANASDLNTPVDSPTLNTSYMRKISHQRLPTRATPLSVHPPDGP